MPPWLCPGQPCSRAPGGSRDHLAAQRERSSTGLALLVFCLPLVATGPILRVFFGPGPGPQIVLAALAGLLHHAHSASGGAARGTGQTGSTSCAVMAPGGWPRWSPPPPHVRMMAALPYLFAGLQIAAPAAFLGAMVGRISPVPNAAWAF